MMAAQSMRLEAPGEPGRAVRGDTVTGRPTPRSRRDGRSRPEVTRAAVEIRARRLLESKLDYVYHPSFDAPDAEQAILGPPASRPKPTSPRSDVPTGLPPYLAGLYRAAPLLTREEEADLFRRMNYLKHRARKLREALDLPRARSTDLDEIERLEGEALEIKNRIIRANLRLVVSIAKKRVGPAGDLFELISDGNLSLLLAVEKFDFARGFKFSTYASWAIMKNFARSLTTERQRRDRFVTGLGEVFEGAADARDEGYEYESDRRSEREAVRGLLGRLDDRERRILVHRYGLGGAAELTLEQLGRELGVTKERVRQIEMRAQDKLRSFARVSHAVPFGS